ncbi:MAG: hypothetical protein J5858_15725, partial [Lentisphaeria bacterium]|nr:hypothetical protein [Lentisphaeria bacterium]
LPDWFRISFQDKNWPNAVEFGDATAIPWSCYSNIVDVIGSPEEKKSYRRKLKEAFSLAPDFVEKLKQEKFYPAALIWENGQPLFRIKDSEYSPVIRLGLKPGTLQSDDFIYKMRNSGLLFYEIGMSGDTRLVSNNTPEEDFSILEERVNRVLKMNPNAYLVLQIGFSKMQEWCERNPDEVIGYATGAVQPDRMLSGDETRGRRLRPSPASQMFQHDANRVVWEFCEFIKTRPWKSRVVAIRPSFGVTAESMYYGSASDMPDTGKAMTVKFRQFLKKRYGNTLSMQKAYHSKKESLETILPPTKEERMGTGVFFRNPASKDRKVLDYYECMQETMADFMISLARTAKESLPGRLVGIYDGYEVGKFYPPEGEHTQTDRLLSSPWIDFLSAPYNYNREARSAGSYGILVHIPSTFVRYRKLSLLEADIRTYVSHLNEGIEHKTPLESVSILRRDMVHNLFDRAGIQFHQFGGAYGPDWFNTPVLRKEIQDSIRVTDFVRKNISSEDICDIAVIYNSKEFSMHGPAVRSLPFIVELKFISLTSLARSGHNFEVMSLETFLQSPKKFKMVVFLNTFTTDWKMNQKLREKIHSPGVTAIWTYAPGLVTPNGFSDQNMADLTGISLKSVWKPLPLAAKLKKNGTIHIGSRKKEYPHHLQNPRVFCNDPNVEILANYEDDLTPAIVRKRLPGGAVSIFTGLPITSMYLWRRLFEQAGCKALVAPGIVSRMNSSLIMIHSANTGKKIITLPKKVKGIIDLYNAKVVAENVNKFSVEDSQNTTGLFYYGDDYAEVLKRLQNWK